MRLSLLKGIGILVCTTHLALAGNVPMKESGIDFKEERQGPRYSIEHATIETKNIESNEITRQREAESMTYTSYRTPSALETDKVRESLFNPSLLTEMQTKATLFMPFKAVQSKIPLMIISPGSEGFRKTNSKILDSLDHWFNE